MRRDLQDLGLDQYLRSINSLPVTSPIPDDAYTFFSRVGRNAVYNSRVQAGGTGSSTVFGTTSARLGGVITSNFAQISTVGTTTQDLMVHNLGTGVLTANNQHLEYDVGIYFNETVLIKIYFGTTELVSSAQAGGDGELRRSFVVGRIGTGSQVYSISTGGLGTSTYNSLGSLSFKVTGQGSASVPPGTVTQVFGIVKWWSE